MFTCGADIYLRCYRLHGGCGFEYTSGGSCGRACIIPPKSRGHLPPVGQRCLPAVLWVVYLRSSVLAGRGLPAVLTSTCGAFGMFTSGGEKMFMPDGMGCIPPVVSPTLGGGVRLSIPPVAPADVPAIFAQNLDIYLRCYRHLPAVLKRAYPAGDVYLRCVFSPLTFNPYLCSIKY